MLIDTPPDLRQQLLRERVGIVHAVLYTHEHADHLFGADDLRLFQFYLERPVPLYCEPEVEQRIRKSFDYAFADVEQTHVGAAPQFVFHSIGLTPFELLGAQIIPLRLKHGPRFNVLGFRIGNIAYCTDTNGLPPESMALLEGLDVLVLDAPAPPSACDAFFSGRSYRSRAATAAKANHFTHIGHDLAHERTNALLPAGMELGYDGQRFPLT